MDETYTKIQNSMLEKLSIAEFAGADFRIVHSILRKTNGYHKEEDWISLSQFQKFTGLSRKTVVKSLQRLINAQVLLVTKRKLVLYRINTVLNSWVVTKRKLVTKCTPTSYQMEHQVVTKRKPTKESITKENIKESENSKIIRILWNFYFRKNYKSSRSFDVNLSKWLEIYSIEEITRAMVNAKYNDYWSKRITPEIFFRTKNPNKEDIDRIGDFLNQKATNVVNVDELSEVPKVIQQQKDALRAS